MSNDLEKLVAAEVQRQLAAVAADSTTKKVLNYLKQSGGHSLGDTWISFDSTVPAGGVPFCGQTVTRAMYQDLLDWATAQGKVKTESEWQSIASANGGNCPYYSSGDGSTNFRMPAVLGYFKGAASASEGGTYVSEGLPNIEGVTTTTTIFNNTRGQNGTNGAITMTQTGQTNLSSGGGGQGLYQMSLDASKSNPVYGNSDHVTPETFTVLVGVYAGSYSNEGSIDAAGLQTAVAALETRPNPNAYITETWQSGTEWYRVWSDGLIEQGGRANSAGNTTDLTMHKEFTTNNYSAFITQVLNTGVMFNANIVVVSRNKTKTTLRLQTFNADNGNSVYWFARGY